MHLSRVLSPVMDVLTPSLFAVRAPLFEAPAVDGGADAADDALRGGGALFFDELDMRRREGDHKLVGQSGIRGGTRGVKTHLRASRRHRPWRRSRRPASPCPPLSSTRARSPWRARRPLLQHASAACRRRGRLCSPAKTRTRTRTRRTDKRGTKEKMKVRRPGFFDAP